MGFLSNKNGLKLKGKKNPITGSQSNMGLNPQYLKTKEN